jgi:hypothetical protein
MICYNYFFYRQTEEKTVLGKQFVSFITADKNSWYKLVKTSDEFVKEEEIIATNGETFPWDDLRLPKFIHPVRYDIELTPNLTSLWVKGNFFCLLKWKQYWICWTYFINICSHIAEKFGFFQPWKS